MEAIREPDASFDSVVDFGIVHHVPAWPMRVLLDHPQATQFCGREFRAGLEAAGLRVQLWGNRASGA